MSLKDDIAAALRSVYDPEMPVNIYELGLIYSLDVDDAGNARILMTLTAPQNDGQRGTPGSRTDDRDLAHARFAPNWLSVPASRRRIFS